MICQDICYFRLFMLQNDCFSFHGTRRADHFLFSQNSWVVHSYSVNCKGLYGWHLGWHCNTYQRKQERTSVFLLQAHKLDGMAAEKEGFVCQENLSTCNYFWWTVLSFWLPLSLRWVFDNRLTPFISGNRFGCYVMDSYFSLLNISFVENYHISIFTTTFEKQSKINQLSNLVNRNRSAAIISQALCSISHQRMSWSLLR